MWASFNQYHIFPLQLFFFIQYIHVSAFSHSPRPSSHYHLLQYRFLKGQTHDISNSISVFFFFQKHDIFDSKILLPTYSETNLNPRCKYLFTFSTFCMSIFSSVQHLLIESLSAKFKKLHYFACKTSSSAF